ncbi:PduM family microcompartment protein [Shewanella sp. D64]|uniref:PduM family microcompartment protein n=1 Tax=unclassified Shewanella TaxID=196818 RepID=UPI0022BA117A|nr:MULTISPECIES: PduM family microcompartment protein [unclassified Shewanella]MEC4725576.1 PduM family microcompartment protein [Shewanella sp. D64]MEC4739628.1 PduM family microcompartment protein [Shewanella sp. E94]WBJ94905.1 PduM family microcompartment protein [Shewanella sp. MTB7]
MDPQTTNQIVVKDGCANVQVNHLLFGLNGLMKCVKDPSGITCIRVILPDPTFINALFALDGSLPTVQAIFEALAIGIEVELTIHSQLLPMLSVGPVAILPVDISDHKGLPVELVTSSIINYPDVALFDHCWLLTVDKPLVTDLAREHMRNHKIKLVSKRGGSC